MSKPPVKLKAPTITPATKIAIAETAPPKFTPCRQCGNPGSCASAKRCVKGFK